MTELDQEPVQELAPGASIRWSRDPANLCSETVLGRSNTPKLSLRADPPTLTGPNWAAQQILRQVVRWW